MDRDGDNRSKRGGGISWKLGPSYIVFVQTRRKYLNIQYHRSATGLNHLAFHVGSRKEVDLTTEELRARETKILYEDKTLCRRL